MPLPSRRRIKRNGGRRKKKKEPDISYFTAGRLRIPVALTETRVAFLNILYCLQTRESFLWFVRVRKYDLKASTLDCVPTASLKARARTQEKVERSRRGRSRTREY